MLVLKRDKGNTIRPQKQHFAKKMLPGGRSRLLLAAAKAVFVCICVRGRFGPVRNVSLQQNANKFAFALGISYFGFAEDTPSRQWPNKFGIALDFSYLCLASAFRAGCGPIAQSVRAADS